MDFIQFKSAPAQKALPCPPNTMTRTPGSCPRRVKVSANSVITPSLKALRTSGRLRKTLATRPSMWMSRVFMLICLRLLVSLRCTSRARQAVPSAHVLRIGLRPLLPLYFAAGTTCRTRLASSCAHHHPKTRMLAGQGALGLCGAKSRRSHRPTAEGGGHERSTAPACPDPASRDPASPDHATPDPSSRAPSQYRFAASSSITSVAPPPMAKMRASRHKRSMAMPRI